MMGLYDSLHSGRYRSIIVIFNARPDGISIDVPFCKERNYILHPLQVNLILIFLLSISLCSLLPI